MKTSALSRAMYEAIDKSGLKPGQIAVSEEGRVISLRLEHVHRTATFDSYTMRKTIAVWINGVIRENRKIQDDIDAGERARMQQGLF